jgi:hypothetical protein
METRRNTAACKIQKVFRSYICRAHRLPTIMYVIQDYLKKQDLKIPKPNKDGRVNSSIAEDYITDILEKQFPNRIKIPEKRKWYDILAYDYRYKWVPINIKISNFKNADNVSNLSSCVLSYTDEILDFNKSYQNGNLTKILINKLESKCYNKNNKKSYYFLVINKNNSKEVICNSLLGLTKLTANINNLPFQINWTHNKKYVYKGILIQIDNFVKCVKSPKPSWQEELIKNIRKITIIEAEEVQQIRKSPILRKPRVKLPI